MDRYGQRDRDALPSMLALLYERRGSLLRPGLSLALQPNGKIQGIVSLSGREARDFYEMRGDGVPVDISTSVPDGGIDFPTDIFTPGSAHMPHGSRAARSAHLPFGFRRARSASPAHSIALAPWPGSADTGQGEIGKIPEMLPARFSVPRHGFDQYGAVAFLAGIVLPAMSHENDMCARELSNFCFHGARYSGGGGQSLDGLCRFVEALNRDYAPPARLDTVFLGTEVAGALANSRPQGSAVEGTQGAVDHGGLRVLGNGRVPEDAMFAMSHARGPVFVDGPTTITCSEDEFSIGRYCQLVAPQGGLSGRAPYGLRLDVVGDLAPAAAGVHASRRPGTLTCKRGHGELVQDGDRQGYFCRACDYAVAYEDIMRGRIP